jgi:hypothetical protein
LPDREISRHLDLIKQLAAVEATSGEKTERPREITPSFVKAAMPRRR